MVDKIQMEADMMGKPQMVAGSLLCSLFLVAAQMEWNGG